MLLHRVRVAHSRKRDAERAMENVLINVSKQVFNERHDGVTRREAHLNV